MASSITLYDDGGSPVVISGEYMKGLLGGGGLISAHGRWTKTGTSTLLTEVYGVNISCVRNSNIEFTATFDTPMANTNYSIVLIAEGVYLSAIAYHATPTTSGFTFTISNGSGATTGFSIQIVGGL